MQQKESTLPKLEVIRRFSDRSIMSLPHSTPDSINELFDRIATILLETWKETGFGYLGIETERTKQNKIGVIVKGSTHYRFVFTDEEIEKWISKTKL